MLIVCFYLTCNTLCAFENFNILNVRCQAPLLFIGLSSLVDELYLGLLCIKTFQLKEVSFTGSLVAHSSSLETIKVNFLSPNSYLFWFTIGGTYFTLGSTIKEIAFVLVFLGNLLSAKITIALVSSKFREPLEIQVYAGIMQVLGLTLGMFTLTLLIMDCLLGKSK